MSSFAWPLFAFLFVIIFKKEISALLENFGKKSKLHISATGLNIDLGSNNPEILSKQQEETTNNKQYEFSRSYQSPVITEEEVTIKNQIINSKLSEAQALEILILHLANKNFIIAMLNIDRLIFNEQILLLRFLNDNANNHLSEDKLTHFYDSWIKKGGMTTYAFQMFIGFLLNFNLIIRDMNGYSISILGKEYLCFIVKIGRKVFEIEK